MEKNAENIAQYITKGRKVAIEGSLRTGVYEKEGKRVYSTSVIVNHCEFLDFAKMTDEVPSDFSGFDNDMTPVDDGDMPF